MQTLMEKWKNGGIPRLGFGGMRLPTDKNGINAEAVIEMVDAYLAAGLNYFDTAYGYQGGKSETTLRETLVKRHPRDSFYLADKLPFWEVKCKEDMARIFNHQLEKCGVDYFDFYLLHALDKDNYAACKKYGGYEYLKELKAAGKVRHIGFSFHGTMADMEEILRDCPELEFVQLQINYLDWIDYGAKEFYDVALAHNLPVIVMEPVRGGALAVLPDEIETVLKASDAAATPASWAMRFCGSLDGVMTILSGMSNMAQLTDNIATLTNFVPLTNAEHATLDQTLDMLRAIPSVPCTACKYCEKCPQDIPIADIFTMYNRYAADKNLAQFRRGYESVNEAQRVSHCIECGACNAVCPQSIAVFQQLKEAVSAI